MQLSSKTFKIAEKSDRATDRNLNADLKSYLQENQINLILGSLPLEAGVFFILFSHRLNKQIGLIVEGERSPQDAEIKLRKILRSLN